MTRTVFLSDTTGMCDTQRRRYEEVLLTHPQVVLACVPDESTGCRFGSAEGRQGLTVKIGYTTYRYQLWASWAPHDLMAQRTDKSWRQVRDAAIRATRR